MKSLVIAPDLNVWDPMAESLLRVRWYEALQFSLGSLMFQMSRAGPLASKSVRGVIGHQLNLIKMQL